MKMKKRLLALLLAAVLVMSLTGCKETLKNVAQKVTGSSNQVQEEDTTRWADATSDQLIIQGIADASAKFDTAVVDGTLYVVFNGIWTRQTSYFTVPSGTLNIMGCGTAEGTQKFKVALWKRWTAVPSMCRTAPIISRPTARTTPAPSPGWTRRRSTG